MTHHNSEKCVIRNLNKWLATGFLVVVILSLIPPVSGQTLETIEHRDLVIDLGDGLMTDAQLTLPSVGKGPFPGVLLIPGGGAPDMDEYMPPYATETGEPARPHLQMAEYLSERGFVVLRYNKRGVGFKGTLADPEVFFNTTIQDLKRDAEKALEVLMQQSEVDVDDITLIGHSESTIIAPRIAVDNSNVTKIVLMGTAGRSYYDIKYFKTVDLRVTLAEEILDTDQDGLLSIPEVLEGLGSRSMALITVNDLLENSTGEWIWRTYWNPDGDSFIDIEEEFKSFLIRLIEISMTADYPGSKLVQSQLALESTIDMIGNVSSSILILNGINDIMTPIEDALLLEQRLTERGHQDHTLITYPGLGHYFYPEDYYGVAMGPIQEYVLQDLVEWLKDPARNIRNLYDQLQNAEKKAENIQDQLISDQTRISDLERQVEELQSTLDSLRNLVYIAFGVAVIAVLVVAVMMFRMRVVRVGG
jgi:esterase/lipase